MFSYSSVLTAGSPVVSSGPSTQQSDAVQPKNKSKTFTLSEFYKTISVSEAETSQAALDALDPPVKAVRPDPATFYRGYQGSIHPRFQGAQYVYINHIRDQILFSQQTVSDFNRGAFCDYPIDELADAMFVEFKRTNDRPNDGCLDVINNGDGTFTSMDNRRLLIAKRLGHCDRTYGIWLQVHAADEKLSKSLSKRFGGAQTWGEAATIRVGNNRIKGYNREPTILDEGKPKQDQQLPLLIREIDLSALHPVDVAAINRSAVNGSIKI